jgi:geranylgeranyl diphosphate synthase type I
MSSFSLQNFIGTWLPKLEDEMRTALAGDDPRLANYYGMIHYHMGWVDADLNPDVLPAGKRLRPMLCLLACHELTGDPSPALPAAAALEILHNFSLVHDDIEDGDETRRHRATMWTIWGVPQAINSGDGMFAMAYGALQKLARRGVSAETTVDALDLFTKTCVALTEGQHLDIGFETRDDVTVDLYMRMIQGKTASLIGAAVAIGALIGGASPAQSDALKRFGQEIGFAFQIQDDILGVWGEPSVTGKAAGNDILKRKKSLPLLYMQEQSLAADAWRALMAGELTMAQLPAAMTLLEDAGARVYAEDVMVAHHQAALSALGEALGAERAEQSPLRALADGLLHRRT